jgi:hypothetical protein
MSPVQRINYGGDIPISLLRKGRYRLCTCREPWILRFSLPLIPKVIIIHKEFLYGVYFSYTTRQVIGRRLRRYRIICCLHDKLYPINSIVLSND